MTARVVTASACVCCTVAAVWAQVTCSSGRELCVAAPGANARVGNPLSIELTAIPAGAGELEWELRNARGQTIDEGHRFEERPSSRLEMYLARAPGTASGRLILRRSQAAVEVPVRFPVGTSAVTALLPKDRPALQRAVVEWMDTTAMPDGGHRAIPLRPDVALVLRTVNVPRVSDLAGRAGATADAVLRLYPGQDAWRVSGSRMEGTVAHVAIAGDGWAGVSVYDAEVKYLIRESLRRIRGIDDVAFE